MNFIMKYPILSVILAIFLFSMAGLAFKVAFTPIKMANQAIDLAQKEFGPKEMLRKYELFKDMSAQLDRFNADIQVYQSRLSSAEKRNNNSRISEEKIIIYESELAGIKSAFNSLAAEYNANMAKFNYSFANAGQLPSGASIVLPREYKPYITE